MSGVTKQGPRVDHGSTRSRPGAETPERAAAPTRRNASRSLSEARPSALTWAQGAIREAETLAAEAFGAAKTWLLANGR